MLQVSTETTPLETADKVAAVQAQLEVGKQLMSDNISKGLANVESAQKLEEDTKLLKLESKESFGLATKARRAEMFKNWRLTAAIAGIVVLLLVMLFYSLFGGDGE